MVQHLQNSSDFSGPFYKIQSDLIETVITIIEYNIEEVARTLFIAIEVVETTDILCIHQSSTVLKYVLHSDIKEVFTGFNILKDKTVTTECTVNNLDEYDCCE